MRNGCFNSFAPVKPVGGGLFAHAEHFYHCGDDIVLEEGIGITRLQPGRTILLLEYTMEFLGFSLLCYKLFQLGDLQVLPVETKIVVEHLGKHTQYCCLILVNGSFDVDVEQDSICLTSSSPVDQHESCRIISEFLPEPLYSLYSLNLLIF